MNHGIEVGFFFFNLNWILFWFHFFLRIVLLFLSIECFTCTNCTTSLAGQRFTSRDEKPYCAECFGELFAKRCTSCTKPITGEFLSEILLESLKETEKKNVKKKTILLQTSNCFLYFI